MKPTALPSAKPPSVTDPSLKGAKAKRAGASSYIQPNFIETKALAIQPTPPVAIATLPVPRRQARREIGSLSSGRTHAHSRNWAGATVPATDGQRFSLITGSWVVPDVHPSGAASNSYVSIWIGLGGSAPASRSMPQIGSEHGWDGRQKVNRLWCQWWLGTDNSEGYLSHHISDAQVSLKAGDRVDCWLDVDPTGFKVTYHWQWTRGGITNELSAEDTRDVPVRADTANWIVERPTEVIFNAEQPSGYKLGRHHPLPELRDRKGAPLPAGSVAVTMEDCLARLGPAGAGELVRRPVDGRLLSLRSIVPGTSRSFVELEPTLVAHRRSDVLKVVRHLP